jgi:hypothetical protein
MRKVRNAQFAKAAVTSQWARGRRHGHFHLGSYSLIYNSEQERKVTWIDVLVSLIIFPQELKPGYTVR